MSDQECVGARLIAEERARQLSEEGWTPEHDDAHTASEMAIAGACYAWPYPRPLFIKKAWPWGKESWKTAGRSPGSVPLKT